MGYESPIDIYTKPMIKQYIDSVDGFIVESVIKLGVNVNKEELEKALKYDRQQYAKGYADGRADRDREIVRCKDCKHSVKHQLGYGCGMNYHLATNGNWFCADGERREDD